MKRAITNSPSRYVVDSPGALNTSSHAAGQCHFLVLFGSLPMCKSFVNNKLLQLDDLMNETLALEVSKVTAINCCSLSTHFFMIHD